MASSLEGGCRRAMGGIAAVGCGWGGFEPPLWLPVVCGGVLRDGSSCCTGGADWSLVGPKAPCSSGAASEDDVCPRISRNSAASDSEIINVSRSVVLSPTPPAAAAHNSKKYGVQQSKSASMRNTWSERITHDHKQVQHTRVARNPYTCSTHTCACACGAHTAHAREIWAISSSSSSEFRMSSSEAAV